MSSRITKLMPCTISDLSRLMRPPLSCPPSGAAHTRAGTNSITRTTRARLAIIRRSPRSRDARRRFVKTITRLRPVSIVPRSAVGAPCDNPASHNDLAAVEDHRLARAGRALRGIEHHLDGPLFQHMQAGRGRLVVVADLRLDAQG